MLVQVKFCLYLYESKVDFVYATALGGSDIQSSPGYNDGKWHHALGVKRAANDYELLLMEFLQELIQVVSTFQ